MMTLMMVVMTRTMTMMWLMKRIIVSTLIRIIMMMIMGARDDNESDTDVQKRELIERVIGRKNAVTTIITKLITTTQ